MSENSSDSVARIRHLNDAFRRTFAGGAVVVTAGVEALPTAKRKAILARRLIPLSQVALDVVCGRS